MTAYLKGPIERTHVQNPTDRSLTLVLEPWATELLLAPGEYVIVETVGPPESAGPPEGWYVDSWLADDPAGDEYLIVYAVDCWDARVLHADGTVGIDWFGIPVGKFRDLAPSVDG